MGALAIQGRRQQFCEGKYKDTEDETPQTDCLKAINADTIAKRQDARRRGSKEILLPFGILHDRYALEEYLEETADSGGVSVFSRFAANISDKEAYVTSDIISGLTGRFIFAINYAAVVVKDDSAATASERRLIESQKANVMRMINNGGTLTMRAQLPVWAVRSPIQQSAASVYASVGLVGPTGNTDSLRASGSAVAEFATTRSIRSIGAAADLLGELLLAGRLGYAISEEELLTATGDKGFGYFQFAIGLLQNNKISLSALYTLPFEDRYKPFTPKLTVNFAAIR
jgi:hypothetical protein